MFYRYLFRTVLLILFFLILNYFFYYVELEDKTAYDLLKSAMPVTRCLDTEEEFLRVYGTTHILSFLLSPLFLERNNPITFLQSEIPFLSQVKVYIQEEAIPAMSDSSFSTEDDPTKPPKTARSQADALPFLAENDSRKSLTEESYVIIYHTHTGETYTLTDGMDRLDGKRGGVVKVGKEIKKVLENNYGLRTVHSDKIHDAQYAISYKESEKTLRELLSKYPETKVVLDIHRDAGRPRKNSLVKVNDQEVAVILLVVGSDTRLPFPTWKENYKFAQELSTKINEKYPGLCLDVRVQDGRYNQFLHPRAVLVEVGSCSNYTKEAVAAARLFADVLGEMILEMIKN